MKQLVPNVEHRMRARHIYANWRKKVHGQKGKEEEVAVYKVILQL
jgi:hypothetical protein